MNAINGFTILNYEKKQFEKYIFIKYRKLIPMPLA